MNTQLDMILKLCKPVSMLTSPCGASSLNVGWAQVSSTRREPRQETKILASVKLQCLTGEIRQNPASGEGSTGRPLAAARPTAARWPRSGQRRDESERSEREEQAAGPARAKRARDECERSEREEQAAGLGAYGFDMTDSCHNAVQPLAVRKYASISD